MEVEVESYELSPLQQRFCHLEAQGKRMRNELLVELQTPVTQQMLRAALATLAEFHETLFTEIIQLADRLQWEQCLREEAQIKLGHMTVDANFLEREVYTPEQGDADDCITEVIHLQDQAQTSAWLLLRCSPSQMDQNSLCLLADMILKLCAGQAINEEPAQYLDVASWLANLQEAPEAALVKDFWQKQIQKLAEQTVLPFELNHGAQAPAKWCPAYINRNTLSEQYTGIKQWCQSNSVSEESLFLTCWQYLIQQYELADASSIGITLSGRAQSELAEVLGPMATTLPVKLVKNSLADPVKVVRQSMQALQAAEKNMFLFNWPQSGAHSPVTVHYGFEYAPLDLPVCANIVRQCSGAEPFKLALRVQPLTDHWHVALQFDKQLFEAEEMKALLTQFETLLQKIVTDSADPHLFLSVLESKRCDLPGESFLSAFSKHAHTEPDRIALSDGDTNLSYQQLDKLSSQIAHTLINKGVKPGEGVALLMGRTLEQVISILSILKTGSFYIPIDPALPAKRQAYIVENSQAKWVVSEPPVPFTTEAPAFAYAELKRSASHVNEPGSLPNIRKKDTAYIIYTSGSTGLPKGVKISHGALCNYLTGLADRLPLQQAQRITSLASVSADLGYTALFGALSCARHYIVVPPQLNLDSQQLTRFLQDNQVDCLKIVPSHLQALLAAATSPQHLICKLLILGGEANTPGLMQHIKSLNEACQIFNHYGPSEATIGICADAAPDQGQGYAAGLPAGRAMVNTGIRIVDSHNQITPLGASGELWVEGDCLADGYVDETLNQGRFTTCEDSRVACDKERRFYRTGDKARLWPSGKVEILGRIDDQIKFAGNRLEPGEIESIINRVQGVAFSVVKVVSVNSVETLAAWVQWDEENRDPDYDSLLAELKDYIPASLLPSDFVTVKSWPLNQTGKIDRAKLPKPVSSANQAGRLPVTETEKRLALCWEQILKRPVLCTRRSFFNSGGNSLLLVELKQRIDDEFNLDLSIVELFQYNTIEDLANKLAQPDNKNNKKAAVNRSARAKKALTMQKRRR